MENSRKLDEVLLLLKGEENAPGVLGKIASHEATLYGLHGNNGLVGKVNVMWRAHVWLLCSLSAIAGYLLKEFAPRIIK